MIVVADASPLIFLAKVRRLGLVQRSVGRTVLVPAAVRDEICGPHAEAVEAAELDAFLARCRIERVQRPKPFARALSRADSSALTLAVRRKADFLLCDDRILRRLAEVHGIRPLGTLGVLLRAMRQHHLTPQEARTLVDDLIGRHSFRIGIEVYRRAIEEIERARA